MGGKDGGGGQPPPFSPTPALHQRLRRLLLTGTWHRRGRSACTGRILFKSAGALNTPTINVQVIEVQVDCGDFFLPLLLFLTRRAATSKTCDPKQQNR